MAKFGEVISGKVPVLIMFYREHQEIDLAPVAVYVGDRAKVIKIDVDKNETLCSALMIKTTPAFVIYKHGFIEWRQSGTDVDFTSALNMYIKPIPRKRDYT